MPPIEKKILSKREEKANSLKEDIQYLFSKINWGSSYLDAKAIGIMNEIRSRIDEIAKESD